VRRFGSGRLGEVPTVGSPLRFDGQRADADLPPPALGEHTDAVLAEFGVDTEEIRRLRDAGIIA
jgi:formyl-CoA transferase